MENFDWVPILVSFLGGGGIVAALSELQKMIKLSRDGVSGREDRRKADIVAERDYAIEQLASERAQRIAADERRHAAETRYDAERENRRRVTEVLIATEHLLQRIAPNVTLPGFPDLEDMTPQD